MKRNLTMRYAKIILLLHIITVTQCAPNHVQTAQHNPYYQKVTGYNSGDDDTPTKEISQFDPSKMSNDTEIHKMKPPRRRFQEVRSTPGPGGANGPYVDGSSGHRSRKYNRKSPTMLSFGDEPSRNRNSQGNHTGHDHGSHRDKRPPGQEPMVECGEHSMLLRVRGGRASLRVNGANTSGLPLSQLPPECGYSVTTNSKDLRFEVPYSACHVQQEDGRHVLPLIWRGVQVDMSCPISETWTQPSTILGLGVQVLKSSVCCTSHGLTFTLPGQMATSELQIKVRGEWLPLLPLAWQCGFTLNRQQGEMLVSAGYTACGVLIKDGQYTLAIRVGSEAVTLVCPADLSDEAAADQASNPSSETSAAEAQPFSSLTSSASPRPPTAERPPALARFSVERSAAIRPRPHPHYQYYHHHQRPFSDSYSARTHLLPHPRPTMGPAGSEPGLKPPTASPTPSQTSDPEAHLVQTSTSVLRSFVPVRPRSASLQTRYTDHHPYYHFYHHPKIPVPFTDPAEEPGTGKQTVPSKRAAWVDPPAPIFSLPTFRTVTNSYPNVPPTLPKMDRFVPQPPPQLNQPRRTALHRPSRPLGKQIKESASADASYVSLPEGRVRGFPWQTSYLAGQIPSLPPSSDHPHAPVPSPDPLPRLFPYIYHPYYSYRGNPYRTPQPDILLPPSTTPSQTPVPTVTVAPHRPSVSPRSHYKPEIASRDSPVHLPDEPLATESYFPPDIPPDHPLYPYYYYYHHHPHQYYQSRPTPDQDQGRRPTTVKRSNPSLDLDQLVVRPSDPHLKSMLDSQPSHLISHQQPANQHPKFLGDDIAGRAVFSSGSDTQTPCGRDSVCSGPVESYTVKGCTVGHHFVFAVPGTLVESSMTSPLSLKSRNESCTPRRLMHADSTLSDLYTVPLHGCGVQEYAVGQTVVHLLEVKGFQAPPTEAGIPHQEAPVGLMMECTGSPGVLGKVTHRKVTTAPPPPVQTPGTMAVQLRIATDGQYNSFLPEPHLPLERLLGRPLYLELVLLNAPGPGSVLLVNYCVAYTHAPHPSWMFIYDGCSRDGELPVPPPSDTQRLTITAFQALSKQSPPTTHQPEVYFLCSTEVCSPKDGDCAMSCISGRPKAGSLS